MNNNEIMTNEVVEATEEVIENAGLSKGVKIAAGIGLILLAVTLIVAGKSLHPGRLAAIIGHRGFLRHSR